jgi:hypothetical protein
VSEDPREVIERAARAHRKSAARADDPAAAARKERAARRKMLAESLWEASGGSIVLILALMVLMGASVVVCFVVLPNSPHDFGLWQVCGLASVFVWMYVVVVPGSMVLTALHAGAVRRIGHGFDADTYLDLLSRKRRHGQLVVTLRFDDAWDESLRRSTTEAIGTWCPDLERAHWEGDRALRLQSAKLATVKSYRKNKTYVRTFTNHPLHAQMKCVARKVLPRLDAVHPVVRIDVEIHGDTCAFDETP